MRIRSPLLALALVLACWPHGIQAQETAPFDSLFAQWQTTPTGSADEAAAAAEVREFVHRLLGPSVVEAFVRYMEAPAGSEEEMRALAVARQGVPEGIRWERAREILDKVWFVRSHMAGEEEGLVLPGERDAELGPSSPLPQLQVDLKLGVSRDQLVAGEIWYVYGEVHNRSNQPIWIVDVYSRLTVPQEIWGLTTDGSAISAFFNTTPRRQNEVVRIDPGRKYSVHWQLDNYKQHKQQMLLREERRRQEMGDTTSVSPIQAAGLAQLTERVWFSVRDFLFFHPGTYRLAANVHIWTIRPTFRHSLVENIGDSFTLSTIHDVEVASSVWVLIVGAILGGLAAFMFLYLLHVRENRVAQVGGRRYFFSGVGMAVVVSVIGTVLAARLTGANFLVNISVNDFWGAIATGFLLQWLGLSYFIRRFEEMIQTRRDEEVGEDEQAVKARVRSVPEGVKLPDEEESDPDAEEQLAPAGDVGGGEEQ